jgi:site-specific recombinase XerD
MSEPQSQAEIRASAPGGKNFLSETEVKEFLAAARGSRHGIRDYAMMLMRYRHGQRVSELVDLVSRMPI